MECYYHPEREGTDTCAICGKSICKECGLEIAGKTYCKECLEKIVGLSLNNTAQQSENAIAQEPIQTETIIPEHSAESIYQPQQEAEMEIPYTPQDQAPSEEYKVISDDSPYNIKDNIAYSGADPSYAKESEKPPLEQQPQVAQNEFDYQPSKQVLTPKPTQDDFIYPDHSYEPQTTSARQELEDKYENTLMIYTLMKKFH